MSAALELSPVSMRMVAVPTVFSGVVAYEVEVDAVFAAVVTGVIGPDVRNGMDVRADGRKPIGSRGTADVEGHFVAFLKK